MFLIGAFHNDPYYTHFHTKHYNNNQISTYLETILLYMPFYSEQSNNSATETLRYLFIPPTYYSAFYWPSDCIRQ